MPTYEYACRSCGEHLEVVQSFTDDSLTECPACGGALRKVFGTIGITFKGDGFYKTDSRASNKERVNGSRSDGGGESKKEPAPSGSTSESRTEPKTDTAKKEPAKKKEGAGTGSSPSSTSGG